MISQSKAQKAGIGINYKPGSNNMIATRHRQPVLWGYSKEAGIWELVRMTPVQSVESNLVFYSAGDDEAMHLGHRRTCHTSVSTL